MKLVKWFAPLFIALTFIACDDSNASFQTIDVDGKFSIDVPDYMVELDLENPDASFQYGNEMKEHYAMVITETHSELKEYGLEFDIESYANLALDYLEMSISNPQVIPTSDHVQTINGMEALGYKIRGLFPENNLEIFYYAMFYKSDEAFYYVTTWTLADREERFIDNMEKIVQSIKEI